MIASLYISMMPVILGGIFNMIFVKIKKLSFLRIPIDCRMSLGGKRIFGDSKTLLGFVGMMMMILPRVLKKEYPTLCMQTVQPTCALFNRYSRLHSLLHCVIRVRGRLP